ncbi:hypothetical protein SAMN05216439_1517 [Methanobrevibacter gottschalkii]|uniref:Uncharacterized protein n=2 Tax=Methanobrevibacter gottschalkii TaxID=190974 RepID=A0A3N5B6I3_9EURY|nr:MULTISPECIES: hypothetical protein [Methanobrevibacter]MCQ2970598.1 hypothetical protein [archaeon]OEC95885.1 hypothetical protein A9505_00650 [Methanobrevibacter sp. A27]RPF52973.1 hypothetical protein EDC42_0534 [Methanobrevibacter gottschalkii DSM 11977]SEK80911.1 hypothetical protein SAMN05216439_1517 [Methanobrevibacter gottschalkii]
MNFLNNCIIVFHVTHRFVKDVQIKGILDMDYYGEIENPLQYFDEDKNLIWHIPPNPYRGGTKEYVAYKKLIEEFKPDDGFIELLAVCGEYPEYYHYDWYDIEMEALTWESI